MKFEMKEDFPREWALRKARDALKQTRVEIGLPEGAPERSKWLLTLHEHGAPGAHIPPRPVLAPALDREETKAAISEGLQAACAAAADGNPGGVIAGFEAAGKAGADGIREYIDAGIEPENAPLTIQGGWIRNFSSGKPVYVPGKGFDKPLYDSGALYDSFDYEIRPTGAEQV